MNALVQSRHIALMKEAFKEKKQLYPWFTQESRH